MTNKVQKIKEWISKTQDSLMDANGNFTCRENEGAYHTLCNLDAYIDSLQEEPVSEEQVKESLISKHDDKTCKENSNSLTQEPVSEDLEKVVEEIVDPTVLNAYGVKEIANRLRRTMIESVSKDLEEAIRKYEQRLEKENPATEAYDFASAIRFGANWQKQQMMKGAISAKVTEIYYPTDSCLEIEATLPEDRFKDGDKVLIIKED